MQTWEYAPQYALRTYAYLLPMVGIAKSFEFILGKIPYSSSVAKQLPALLQMAPAFESTTTTLLSAGENKPLLFAMLRSFLAFVSCYSELSFLSAVHDRIHPTIAHWTALCTLTAAGNFHSGQAFLPSSSVMILWRLSAANQLRERHALAIFWGLVAVLAVGWPFCAVLFISTGFWALWKAGLRDIVVERCMIKSRVWSVAYVLLRTLAHAIAIQAVVIAIDYYYYGKLVSPILNIFVYNAQSGGDELYGVEPLSYYAKNLLLNFNIVALMGVLSLPLLMLRKAMERFLPKMHWVDDKHNQNYSMAILVLVPMYIWMAIVFPRAHKEERFLFPIYPMICFGAGITMHEVLNTISKIMSSIRSTDKTERTGTNARLVWGLALLCPFAAISISRSFALYHHYSAPLAIYRELFHRAIDSPMLREDSDKTIYVCTAGEWHRYPSSFFLPPNHQLGFLKSSFTGQLPQQFTEFGSKEESLEAQAGEFNDVNKEEMDRYVDIRQCSYVIELVPSDIDSTQNIPESLQYMRSWGTWTQLASYEYLDAESTSVLHRILYLPFGRGGNIAYKGYNLYMRD